MKKMAVCALALLGMLAPSLGFCQLGEDVASPVGIWRLFLDSKNRPDGVELDDDDYSLQTWRLYRNGKGFYSNGRFDLKDNREHRDLEWKQEKDRVLIKKQGGVWQDCKLAGDKIQIGDITAYRVITPTGTWRALGLDHTFGSDGTFRYKTEFGPITAKWKWDSGWGQIDMTVQNSIFSWTHAGNVIIDQGGTVFRPK